MSGAWQIPPSLLDQLASAPLDRPVALLLRHSVRDPFPPNEVGNMRPITDVGQRLAREVGAILGPRLVSLHTSPIIRCVQTADALTLGANVSLETKHDRLLGDPGIFVIDGRRAWRNWEKRGHEGVMAHLASGDGVLAGMAEPTRAARFLVHHMLCATDGRPGIHIFVTHDSLVTATAARLLGERLGPDDWPWYLEAASFWADRDGICTAYRDRSSWQPGPLCGFNEGDVIALARREVAATVGLDSGARFFLAGGAFKTLPTGHPPRDLDLWAASQADRERLIQALQGRGARPLAAGPFADAFQIHGRTVEIPHAVEPTTLEGRLQRFDIALSAIGVEHKPDDTWRAVIDPRALISVREEEVHLLKPLINWKYALTTLERARRYADELAFGVPPGEEAEIWRVFAEQTTDERQRMLQRYARTGNGTHGVCDEAVARLE